MSAPTEKEIRAAIEKRFGEEANAAFDETDDLAYGLDRVAITASAPIVEPAIAVLEGLGNGSGWEPLKAAPGGFWHDLRPSEAVRLRTLVRDACDRAAESARKAIVDELTAAALQFAAEYPEAPRAKITA